MAHRLCRVDVDQHSLTVDRTDRQTDDFVNPQSRCMGGCSVLPSKWSALAPMIAD